MTPSPYIIPGIPAKKTADEIIDDICSKLQLTPRDIIGSRSYRSFVDARIIITWHLRKKTSLTFEDVGQHINKNHATAIYYYNLYEKLYNNNKYFKQKVNKICY